MHNFVHLHTHSDYSLLNSTTRIEEIVATAQQHGVRHASLTDDGNLFGSIEFYRACKKADINPILGCDCYIAPHGRHKRDQELRGRYNRIVLLAKNAEGFQNLVELSSHAYSEGFYYKPRIDDELLQKYHHNLIAFCGGRTGDIGRDIGENNFERARTRAQWYSNLFGAENFYLELQQHSAVEERINKELVDLAAQLNISLVATNNCFYTGKEDAKAHEVLRCIGQNRELDRQREYSGGEYYIKNPQEMNALFGDYPQALENSLKIAEMCKVELQFPGPQLPHYKIPPEFESAAHYLRHLAYQGFKQRYDENSQTQLTARLNFELDIIIQMSFEGYFLIVWDLLQHAHTHHIPVGPGRGSGVGSLVAYSLRITNINPIQYGLIFERFLNPERISMPDFDIDFCYERRGEIIKYINQHYGSDHVGQIITFGRLKARAVVRDVARVLGISYADGDSIAKLIPMGVDVKLNDALRQEPKLHEFIKKDASYQELMEISKKLEGLHRHASTHAAGIVIGRERLTNYVPLYRDPKSGAISTQYSMEHLEDLGLVKMDILGLKTLTLIKNTLDLILAGGRTCDIESIPINDPETFKMLSDGNSGAIFQFEAAGMQRLLKRSKPTCIEDLIALTSLYRPGPMDHIDEYVSAKNGKKKPHFPLKILEEVLKETYGVIIYQEQVIEIVQKVAGFTPGKADIMRKVIGKKQDPEIMNRMKQEFIDGALTKDISRRVAENIFNLIIPFAGYGFNKSHAAAYSMLAYQTAYLKKHFPCEFMAANLTNEINNSDTFMRYLDETRQMGIKVSAPDVNRSRRNFSVVNGEIIFGLIGIKNIGSAVVDEILRARDAEGQFKDIETFLMKVNTTTVNKRSVEACIFAGLFDRFGMSRAMLIHNLPRLMKVAEEKQAMQTIGQKSLFLDNDQEETLYEQVEEFSHVERMMHEREMLGAYFTGHPLDSYREIWQKLHTPTTQSWQEWDRNKKHTIIGCVVNLKSFVSKRGNQITLIDIEDYDGRCEVMVFADSDNQSLSLVAPNVILGIEVEMQVGARGPQLIARKFFLPEDAVSMLNTELHIELKDNIQDVRESLASLRDMLITYHSNGNSLVFFHLPTPHAASTQSAPSVSISNNNSAPTRPIIRASAHFRISANAEIIQHIQQHNAVAKVWSK